MGKRNKLAVQTNATTNKITKFEENDVDEKPDLTVINVDAKNKTTKNKKKKRNKDVSEKNENLTNVEGTESDCPIVETDETINKKKKTDDNVNNDINQEIHVTSKSNIEDESTEVKKQANAQKKSKKSDFSQEDDVKEEDIDKFCDEIDEEDNLQYLNWVEQIEAKLNSNKKKPKCFYAV